MGPALIIGPRARADDGLRPTVRAAALLLCATPPLAGLVTLPFDVPVALGALLAGWWGWTGCRRGLRAGAATLAGLIAVFAWAVPAGKWIAPAVARVSGLPAVPNRYLAVVVAAGLLYGASRLTGHVLTRRADGHRHPLAGMGCGLLAGGLAAPLVAAAVAAVEPPVRMALALGVDRQAWVSTAYGRVATVRGALNDSVLGSWAARRYADRDEVLRLGATLAVVARYDGALTRLKRRPQVARLLEDDPTIRRVVDEMTLDARLYTALRSGRIDIILDSPTVLRLLDDTRLARTLRRHRDRLHDDALLAIPGHGRAAAARRLALVEGHGRRTPQVLCGAEAGQRAPRMGEPIGRRLRDRTPGTATPAVVRMQVDRVVEPLRPM